MMIESRIVRLLCLAGVVLCLRLLYVYIDRRSRSGRLSATDTCTRKARYPFGMDIILETLHAQKTRTMLDLWKVNVKKYGHTYRVSCCTKRAC